MAEPLIVEVSRGGEVESVHHVSAIVTAVDGTIVDTWGDADRLVFPRSAVKMFQAIPLIETGAADALGVSEAELALACASHSGEAAHLDAVRAWLNRIGCAEDDLECGAQHGRGPSPVANNCSGKHAGFLTVARHLGIEPSGYLAADHPVQRLVSAAMSGATGVELRNDAAAIDGCGIPAHRFPLRALAGGIAGFVSSPPHSNGHRLTSAMERHAYLVAGTDRVDTELIQENDDLVVKTGAEGVFVGARRGQWGLALKCHDGATRAAEATLCWLLDRLGVAVPHETSERVSTVRNWAGADVGSIHVRPLNDPI